MSVREIIHTRWQLAVAISVTVILAGVIAVALGLVASGGRASDTTFELAMIRALAEEPRTIEDFQVLVMAQRNLRDKEYEALYQAADITDKEKAQGHTRWPGESNRPPIVWYGGASVEDIAAVYVIQVTEDGWGWGGPRGQLDIYTNDGDGIVAWRTSSQLWYNDFVKLRQAK